MKKILAILLALTFAGCAANPHEQAASVPSAAAPSEASAAAAAPEASGPRMETAPTYHKGYKLTFRSRTSTYDVTYEGEENGFRVFHFDTREKIPYDYLYTHDMKLAGIRDAQQEFHFDPPVGYVDFPLYVGKKWAVTYKSMSNNSHTMGETSVEVQAFESVTVPYGKVDAYRIQVRSSDRGVSRMNPAEIFWYSPDIGYYVKHDTNKPIYEDPFELVAVSK